MDFTDGSAHAGGVDRRAALLFGALGLAWGIPYLLIKVAIVELSPAALLCMRTVAGALILLPLAARRGELAGLRRHWRAVTLYACVEIVVPWLMLGHAESRLSSSTTGLLIAATPLVIVGFGLLVGQHEVLGRSGWAGLLLGFAGVAALVGLEIDASDRIAVLQLAAAVTGYAIGPMVLARSLSGESGVAVLGASFAIAATVSAVVMAVTGSWPTAVPSARVLGAVAVLVVVCTVGAFLALFELVQRVGAVRATAVTYVNPAVAIIVGAIFLDEQITATTLLGFALVLAGSVLLARRPAARETSAAPGGGRLPRPALAAARARRPRRRHAEL